MELRLAEQEALTLYRIILRWDELGSLTTEDDEERQLLWDLLGLQGKITNRREDRL